jgi:hypothetical protein
MSISIEYHRYKNRFCQQWNYKKRIDAKKREGRVVPPL